MTNHEKRVAQHLAARSIEHYLPLYRERSQWSDRSVELERPLFSGYVFTRFARGQRIAVISVPGVIHLLGRESTDGVSSEELERIRQGLAGGYLLRPHPWLQVGAQVRVRGGIFDGVAGMVTELRGACRVVIALSAVQQCFSLELQADQIERMNPVAASPLAARNSAPARLQYHGSSGSFSG